MDTHINAHAGVVMQHGNDRVKEALSEALASAKRGQVHAAASGYLRAVRLWSITSKVAVTPELSLQIAARLADRCGQVFDIAGGASRGPYDEGAGHA